MYTQLIRQGTVREKLYNIGSYPGAVASSQMQDLIMGEVYQLSDRPALQLLDDYED